MQWTSAKFDILVL